MLKGISQRVKDEKVRVFWSDLKLTVIFDVL